MKKFLDESWLVLVMGIVFAVLLAGTQSATKDRIRANEIKKRNDAITHVVPAMGEKGRTEELELKVDETTFVVFKCFDDADQFVGWAVQHEGGGFIDKITLMVGLSPDGKSLTGMEAIKHTETPGLGNKIDPGNDFPLQFVGKATVPTLEVKKGAVTNDSEILAITGATWSSRYVTDIINEVTSLVGPKLDELR
ncbi:MAG: FMN-binding protein [Planctomycetota bacterium]